MATLSYHTGPRGVPGFLVSVTGASGNTNGTVIPAYVPTTSAGIEAGPTGPQPAGSSQSVVPATGSRFMLANAQGVSAGSPTFRATGAAYAGYATPTDMLVISGSASKTVIVTGLWMQVQGSSSTGFTVYIVKRTTANTGGTSATQTPVSMDSTNAAATAVINLYSAAPTLGTSAGNVLIFGATTTSAPSYSASIGVGGAANPVVASNPVTAIDIRQPITLRGAAESLAWGFNGGALPAGFLTIWGVEWSEV